MTVLILGLNYLPESTSIGPYTADLAEYLISRGHSVRVITGFPLAPNWRIWDGYRGKRFLRETVNGVSVLRTWLYVPADPRRALQRILFDCSFGLSALAGLFLSPRPDLIVAISPPLQLGLTALFIGLVRRARVFLQIQDLVPDAAVAVGAMRPGSAALRFAQALERFVYRRSHGIGVICEGMRRNLLSKSVPPEKLALMPNYVDLAFMAPPARNHFRERHGIASTDFLVMYSGSVAGKQGLETFVAAAADLEADNSVTCCLIGEGPYLPALKLLAEKSALRRFRFIPMQPREALPEQLSAADVLLITQRREVRDMVFPGKLLYYMAAGCPVLAAVSEDSETGIFIREHRIGMVVAPEDPVALAVAIRWLRENPAHVAEWGRRSRATVQNHFDRSVVLDRFASHLETTARL